MQHNALSDTLRTDDGRPLSPIAPGTPHSQDDQKNRSMRQLRNVAEDLQTKRNREKEERLQRSIQATLKKLSRKVDKSVKGAGNQGPQRQGDELEGDRSPGASPRRQRPPKPNRFWKDSMQKVAKQDPSSKPPQNRQGDADEPRATRFPELEDFLNKSPEDPSHLDRSPSAGKQSSSPTLDLEKSRSRELEKSPRSSGDFRKQFEENFNQKPRAEEDLTNPEVTHHWNEEDNNKSEVLLMPLDRGQDDSMEFDEGDDDDKTDRGAIQSPPKANAAAVGKNEGLTISMENLLGGADHGKPPTGRKAAPVDDRPTVKSPEHQLMKRPSRGSRRGSKRPHDIQSNEQYSEALFDFFKSLDFDPSKANQGTVRASYRSGRASYNLYGVPAKKPGEKSQVFVQSQDGFDRDLPPVRLSGEQTAQLVNQFKELDALDSHRPSADEEAPGEDFLGKNNVNQNPLKNAQELDFSLLESKQDKFERKAPTPSKDKHVRAADGTQRNNKTFWSSGYERSIPNQPKTSQIQKKGMPGAPAGRAGNFLSEFDKTMATQSIPSEQNKDANTSTDDPNNSRAGISFKNIVYNVGSSVFGGFGSFSQSSRGQGEHPPKADERTAEPKTRSNIDQPPANYVVPEQTPRSKTPGGRGQSPTRRPNYSRFQPPGQAAPQQVQGSHQQPPPAEPRAPPTKSPARLVYSPPHERTKGYPQPAGWQDPRHKANAKPDGPYGERQRPQEANEASNKSAHSYRSPSRRSRDSGSRGRGRASPGRVQQDPVVLKLTAEDINDQRKESQESQYQQPFKGNPNDYKPPQVFMNNREPPRERPTPVPRSAVEEYMAHEPPGRHQIDSNYQQVQSDVDLNLPNVILLVADNVRLIRNNSVPLLQVQVEIIQNALNIDNDMCMLGLNDVIYIVPEFTPAEYDSVYSRLCTGNEFEEYGPFFEHYKHFRYNGSPMIDNIPERLMGLHKNSMTAIERDHYEPDLRGKAFINLKHVPNGHYTIFHLRIGQPISINSRLKVLGRAKGNFVNINREKISDCKKPQLDLNHSSSRISRRETSKFKIMKAKNNKKRDNKVMCLNSDEEEEDEETVTPQEKRVDEDFRRMFNAAAGNAEQSGEEGKEIKEIKSQEAGLEMEFDDGGAKEKAEKSKKQGLKPPPLQDSKDYYNSTQRMTEAMIQNPQFQLFSIDEEESVRTSMRESEDDRKKKKAADDFAQGFASLGTRGYGLDDKSMDATPNAGTPPDDAPEDAFRNVHRQVDLSQSLEPVQQTHLSEASVDPISKQIEDYQRESLAQLATMNLQPTPEPRPQRAAPPKVERSSPVREYVPPQQRERRDSVHSRGSARSRQSARSNESRGSRRSTRVKTISLRELEGEPAQHGRDGRPNAHVRAVPRQRSRSLSGAQEPERDTLQHPQYPGRQRSPSQTVSPSKEQADDPFTASMRETTKLEIINLNHKRPLHQPSVQRQQDMVALYGRKEDRTMPTKPAPANPTHYQMQDRGYHQPNTGADPNRSRSPMTAGRPQDRFQHPGQAPNLRAGPPGATHARQPSGSRPWKRDRSRGRADLRSNEGSPSRQQMMQQPDLVQQPYPGRASPAREPLRYDRLGNPIGVGTPLERPKSSMEDPTNPRNASMRSDSGQRRPGSASQLQNSRDHRDQSRNRFFSPQARGKSSHHSRSLSQGRVVEQRPNALFSPSQLLAGGPNPSAPQMMANRPYGQASRSPLRQHFSQPTQPNDPRNNRNSSRFSDENFSDENHSPVRPIGQMNMQQSVPLRQQHHGMKQRFGNSITGSVTNASVPTSGAVGGFNKYGNAQPMKNNQRPQRQPRF